MYVLESTRIQPSIRGRTHVTGSAVHMENYLACFFSIEPWHVLWEHWFQHILDKNFTRDRSVWRNEVQAGLASPYKTSGVQNFLAKSRSRSCNRWSSCSFRLRFLCVINWTLPLVKSNDIQASSNVRMYCSRPPETNRENGLARTFLLCGLRIGQLRSSRLFQANTIEIFIDNATHRWLGDSC